MNQPRRARAHQRRRSASGRPLPTDLWRPSPPLPEAEPIAVPHEVGALLRSLGEPQVPGGDALAAQVLAVVERAAAVALALALSADVLADPDA